MSIVGETTWLAGEVLTWQGEPQTADPRRLLRTQGYRDMNRVRPAIWRAAERAAEAAPGLAAPQARFTRQPIVECAGGRLELANGCVLSCPIFDRLLGHCVEVVVFVLTLGPALEDEVRARYARDELLDAYLLDSAGWLLVERASRALRADLSRVLAGEGVALTGRLGPGYDYRDGSDRARWDLEQQHALFGCFGGVDLPVTLMDSSAMTPRMSRSGLFGASRSPGGSHSRA